MLLTVAEVRSWLGSLASADTAPNTKIESLIYAVQDFCNDYTGRKLEGARYGSSSSEKIYLLDGTGKSWVYVPNFPVSHINSVCVDGDRVFGTGTQIGTDDIVYYPESGKIVSEGGYFTRGKRNVKIDYTAGYAPVPILGGTWNTSISTYPMPYDLKQVMIEMVTESIRQGVTSLHSIVTEQEVRTIDLLEKNKFWKSTLHKYKRFDNGLGFYE